MTTEPSTIALPPKVEREMRAAGLLDASGHLVAPEAPDDVETPETAAEAPQRPSRRVMRSMRAPGGKVVAAFIDGPLKDRTLPVEPTARRLHLPVVLNVREREVAALAGQLPPVPIVIMVNYRRVPGRNAEGCLLYRMTS